MTKKYENEFKKAISLTQKVLKGFAKDGTIRPPVGLVDLSDGYKPPLQTEKYLYVILCAQQYHNDGRLNSREFFRVMKAAKNRIHDLDLFPTSFQDEAEGPYPVGEVFSHHCSQVGGVLCGLVG